MLSVLLTSRTACRSLAKPVRSTWPWPDKEVLRIPLVSLSRVVVFLRMMEAPAAVNVEGFGGRGGRPPPGAAGPVEALTSMRECGSPVFTSCPWGNKAGMPEEVKSTSGISAVLESEDAPNKGSVGSPVASSESRSVSSICRSLIEFRNKDHALERCMSNGNHADLNMVLKRCKGCDQGHYFRP